MESKICLREVCKKVFEPKKRKQVYCSTKCRTYAFRENKYRVHDLGDGITVKEKSIPKELQKAFKSSKKPFKDAKFGYLIPKQENIPSDDKESIRLQLQEYEEELSVLGNSSIAQKRKRWVVDKIYDLKFKLNQ